MSRIGVSRAVAVWSLAICLAQPAARGQEEKFGEVDFPISCSAAAQMQFNRAVAMLHSFFFPETVKAFTALAQQEPSCAMAYWGIAISQRPNPLVAPFPAELMGKAWQAIEAGRAATTKTRREKDWIDALAVFFKDYDKVDLRTRTLAYEAAMARLTERYPDDTEAAIFYALALNEAVDLNDKTYAKQFKAAAILQDLTAGRPGHHDHRLSRCGDQAQVAGKRDSSVSPGLARARMNFLCRSISSQRSISAKRCSATGEVPAWRLG
jgi:hypothetical protein